MVCAVSLCRHGADAQGLLHHERPDVARGQSAPGRQGNGARFSLVVAAGTVMALLPQRSPSGGTRCAIPAARVTPATRRL